MDHATNGCAPERAAATALVTEPPIAPSARAALRWAVNAAVLAPSKLNTQPWRFVLRDEALELYADEARALPVSDPSARELLIACGAALANVELAIRAVGHVPETTILPLGAQGQCLARVSLGRAEPIDPRRRALFGAIPRRRTDRSPLDGAGATRPLLVHLQGVAGERGAGLRLVQSAGERLGLAELVARADARQERDPAYRAELRAWVADRSRDSRDGIPPAATLPGAATRPAPFAPRAMDAIDLTRTTLPHDTPALAVLWTRGDGRRDWLLAGLALEEVLLSLSVAGLAAAFVNQPIEEPALRALVRDELDLPGFPQALLRMGTSPSGSGAPATSRRPVAEVLR